jgi:hypothetical protein
MHVCPGHRTQVLIVRVQSPLAEVPVHLRTRFFFPGLGTHGPKPCSAFLLSGRWRVCLSRLAPPPHPCLYSPESPRTPRVRPQKAGTPGHALGPPAAAAGIGPCPAPPCGSRARGQEGSAECGGRMKEGPHPAQPCAGLEGAPTGSQRPARLDYTSFRASVRPCSQ